MPTLGRANTGLAKSTDEPKLYFDCLVSLCEDNAKGIGSLLTAFLNGTKSSTETIATMTESLQLIINMGGIGSLKQAFEIVLSTPSSDKSSQRLEWLLLSTLTPILATSAFASIHSDLVIGALNAIGAALAASEGSQSSLLKPGAPTRTKTYFYAILGTLREITQFMHNATYPSTCQVKMSVFKSVPAHDHDPTWMTFRFAHIDDAITTVSYLVSLFCHRITPIGWPVFKADEDQRIALLRIARSLIELFLPNGLIARMDPSGQRHLSASTTSIHQLYQACGHCVREGVLLLNCNGRNYSALARSILEILHHHIMTLDRRYTEWKTGAGSRAFIVKTDRLVESNEVAPVALSIKDFRKEVPAMASLETILVECLTSVVECAIESSNGSLELSEPRFLTVSLLFSDQLLLLSDDESGKNVQRAVLRIATALIPCGFFEDPLTGVDYVLKHFIHLEQGLLANLVRSSLNYARIREFGRESAPDRNVRSKKPPHSTDHDQGHVTSSKRTLDDIDFEPMPFGSPEWSGKRARMESQLLNLTSLESAACSSIVSASQFSQWPGKQQSSGLLPWSPSDHLLGMLGKFTDHAALSHTASQGPRGVQPQLSVNNLRTISIILYLWTHDTSHQEAQGSAQKAEELAGIVELIGKQYLRWVLSPGMHNASLNQSYLESSYPLVLDIVATVSTLSANESFKELLICLSSGPWFTDISNKELWSTMPSSPGTHNDATSGEYQLFNALVKILERTAILSHLRDDPSLLQASQSFLPQKCKALLVMSTLPYYPQLAEWRAKVIVDTLKYSYSNPEHPCADGHAHSLAGITIESLSILSSISPNMETTIETVLGFLCSEGIEEDVLITLASSMGAIACGVSTMERLSQPMCRFDILTQSIDKHRVCSLCYPSLRDPSITSRRSLEEPAETGLSVTFLHPFQWLIRTCTSITSRLALLEGLYRVFCHLDLHGNELRSVEFGKFMLGQLDDQNKPVREAAGEVVKLLAQKAGAMLVEDPLGSTTLDGTLTRFSELIARRFTGSLKASRFVFFLQLCRRVMQNLPEDHPVYNRLLAALIDQVFADSTALRSAQVLDEMSKVATDKNISRSALLRPQRELFCTQIIQKLDAGQEDWLEVLYAWTGLSQSNFLSQHVSGMIPKLIILRSRELIEKLATLMTKDAGTLCFEQLDHILAEIFMHKDDGVEPSIDLLRILLFQAKQGGEDQVEMWDIAALIAISKVGLLIHVSLELGHEKMDIRNKAKTVIEIVEGNDWKVFKQQSGAKKVTDRRSLASFLQQHILAVLSEVNKVIMGTGQRVTLGMKAKYLRSLAGLVELLQPIQSTVLSQIFSPLKMALNIPGLRIHTLRVLKSIVDLLDPIQLDSLLGHLVQSLGDIYLQSNTSAQAIIFSIFDRLLVQSQDKLRLAFPGVGALPTTPEFEKMNMILRKAKAADGFEHQLQGLIDRLGSENSDLVRQAVMELKEFLLENEEQLLIMTTNTDQEANGLLSSLFLTLLSEVSRFRGVDSPIPMVCAECLGIIGAVDPEKISGLRASVTTTVYANLNIMEEARDFVCELITVQLVGKSRSIGDVPSESHWAFTLQELLSFCGITKDVLESEPAANLASRNLLSQRTSAASTPSYYASSPSIQPSRRATTATKLSKDRWRAFPRPVQEVLELLIDAKYQKTESTPPKDHSSPLFPQLRTFQDWLTRWTLSLIAKVTGRNSRDVFQACKHVVPYDTDFSLYILPHLVLHVLLEGSERDQREIVNEMAAILGDGHDWRQQDGDQMSGKPKQPMSEIHQLGTQTAFVLFDHISRWIQQRRNSRTRMPGTQRFTPDLELQTVQNHLQSISHEVIAQAAFRNKAYARALFHSEQHIRDLKRESNLSEMGLQKLYENYQQLYVWMDEPDGMEGISSLITCGTLPQYLLQCESAGRWEEVQAYHELGIQNEPFNLDHHIGLYRALDNLGQYDTMLNAVDGDIHAHPGWEEALNDFRISASWKSQRWDSLEDALSRSVGSSFEGGLGLLIRDLRENRVEEFDAHLRQTRSILIAPLAAASMESYSRAYDRVVQLHMLHELEVAFHSWNRTSSPEASSGSQIAFNLQSGGTYTERIRLYQSKLTQRLEIMTPSFKIREQVAMLRRVVFFHIRIPDKDMLDHEDMQYLTDEAGRLWLESARTARKSHNDQLSYSAMLHAEHLGNTPAVIERVKWGFSHNNERQAIKTIDSFLTLKRGMVPSAVSGGTLSRASSSSLMRPKSSSTSSSSSSGARPPIVVPNTELLQVEDRILNKSDKGYIRAKAILLRTRWMDKSNLVSLGEISEGFRDAAIECELWEKVYYVAGQYFFKLFESSKRSKTRLPLLPYATQGCRLYCKALSLGPKYLYQILPRLLTYWLDLGRRVHVAQSSSSVTQLDLNEFKKINELMNDLADNLPEYMIISRICHKNPDAFFALQRIIANVVIAYPDQAIWQMVSVSRSIVQERKRVCNKILHTIQLQPVIGAVLINQVNEALDLCDNLIALCMVAIPDKYGSKVSLDKVFPRLSAQLKRKYNAVVPGQRSLWPTLPKSSETMASHQPFKSNLPMIEGFLDEIDVMSSLQKPRKITVIGSDGLHYTFLCKPKDDLRKDAKVMEFNSLVNTLLKKNREANRRDLYVRTYAVVPLNEEYGLIEWVHNTTPYRHLVHKLYRLSNHAFPSNTDIKRYLDHEDHVRLFVKDLLPKFPPVFYQWFKEIAPEPTAWFAARLRFTRTAAVMSMAGYIVGLGDRHGENLLLDERNGDVVHVDFNCLFDAGKLFPKPERVPFRLTHNMVDGMGLSGYDGVYRAACEKTMGVFRENMDSLVSVLEGFVHDPLVEWSNSRKRGQQKDAAGTMAAPNGGAGVEDARMRLLRGRTDSKAAATAQQQQAASAMSEAAASTADGEPYDEQQAEKAHQHLSTIRRKLNGSEGQSGMFSLSVVGQVEELILNATSPENLGKMYIGWSAYL